MCKDRTKNIIGRLTEFFPELMATVIAPAILALSSVLTVFSDFSCEELCKQKFPIILFFIGAILQIIFFVFSYRRKIKNADLVTDNNRLSQEIKRLENEIGDYGYNNYEVFNGLSRIIFNYFDFTSDERISIYKINNDNSCFNILGRYSRSNTYGKLGRKHYPIDHGFIGKVISCGNGMFFTDNELPEFVDGHKQEYYNCLDRCKVKFDRDVLKTMKMASRAYYCRAIYDQQSRPISVVVIESMNSAVLTPKLDQMDQVLKTYNSIIATLSEKSKIIIPDIAFAEKKGF